MTEEQVQKWKYQADPDGAVIRSDGTDYQYYSVRDHVWKSDDDIFNLFEGLSSRSMDFDPIEENKVPAFIKMIDGKWSDFQASQGDGPSKN